MGLVRHRPRIRGDSNRSKNAAYSSPHHASLDHGTEIANRPIASLQDHIAVTTHTHEPPILNMEPKVISRLDIGQHHIVVVNKPPSMPVHPCGKYHAHSVTEMLANQEDYKSRWYPLNRLDRVTSGLVLFTSDSSHVASLTKLLRGSRKLYLARVLGHFDPDSLVQAGRAHVTKAAPDTGSTIPRLSPRVSASSLAVDLESKKDRHLPPIDSNDGSTENQVNVASCQASPGSQQDGAIIVTAPLSSIGVGVKSGEQVVSSDGKAAETRISLLATDGITSIVRCELQRTGRQHQIRAHLSYLGHPIDNDGLYGGRWGLTEDMCQDTATLQAILESTPPDSFAVSDLPPHPESVSSSNHTTTVTSPPQHMSQGSDRGVSIPVRHLPIPPALSKCDDCCQLGVNPDVWHGALAVPPTQIWLHSQGLFNEHIQLSLPEPDWCQLSPRGRDLQNKG